MLGISWLLFGLQNRMEECPLFVEAGVIYPSIEAVPTSPRTPSVHDLWKPYVTHLSSAPSR